MIKGGKVYDPLTNTWSTGYWVAISPFIFSFLCLHLFSEYPFIAIASSRLVSDHAEKE